MHRPLPLRSAALAVALVTCAAPLSAASAHARTDDHRPVTREDPGPHWRGGLTGDTTSQAAGEDPQASGTDGTSPDGTGPDSASPDGTGSGRSGTDDTGSDAITLATDDGPSVHAQWGSSRDVEVGHSVALAGQVRDAGSRPLGRIRLDRRVGSAWQPVHTIDIAADGSWSERITPPSTLGVVRYRIVWLGAGGGPLASGELPALTVYRLNTYDVQRRGRVSTDLDDFARDAARTFADQRGWARAYQRFERVERGGDFTLVLAQARTMPTFSRSCSVQFSCRVGRFVVINETPWRHRTKAFTGDLRTYRHMVVNHETGHWLGLGHQGCSRRGALAPVMMQQSKGLSGCRSNAWPLPAEIAALTR